MFGKKERIEDDFISYGSGHEETKKAGESSLLSKMIQLLLVVVLLGVVGFMGLFGYRYLQNGEQPSSQKELPEPLAKAAQPLSAEPAVATAPAKRAASHAQQKTDAPKQRMYTQEEMQQIVKMLMSQMQNGTAVKRAEADTAQTTTQPSEPKTADKKATEGDTADALVTALNLVEVDQIDDVEPELPGELKDAEQAKAKSAQKGKKVDHYNKVVVSKSANSYDDLANLSVQIGDIVNDMKAEKDKSSGYTSSIKKEVSARVAETRVVVVKSGDTLSKIAKRVYGKALAYTRILKANPDLIKNPNNIYIGQRLRVPMNAQ